MKRLPLYILLIALTFAAPVERVDVGKLRPVEVVMLYKENGYVILQTDTQDRGIGDNVIQALEDMYETAPAVIYLDTAEFLLIDRDAQEEAECLRHTLKGSVKVCLTEGKTDAKDAAKYLAVHHELPRFKQWRSGDNIPVLTNEKIIEKSRI